MECLPLSEVLRHVYLNCLTHFFLQVKDVQAKFECELCMEWVDLTDICCLIILHLINDVVHSQGYDIRVWTLESGHVQWRHC